jgi:hypothetical protein
LSAGAELFSARVVARAFAAVGRVKIRAADLIAVIVLVGAMVMVLMGVDALTLF